MECTTAPTPVRVTAECGPIPPRLEKCPYRRGGGACCAATPMASDGDGAGSVGGSGSPSTPGTGPDGAAAEDAGGVSSGSKRPSKQPTNLLEQIATLKEEQAAIRARRQQVQKDLKNAQKRKRRLKARVRQLTNKDLVDVLLMRGDDVPEAAAKGGPDTAATGAAGRAP